MYFCLKFSKSSIKHISHHIINLQIFPFVCFSCISVNSELLNISYGFGKYSDNVVHCWTKPICEYGYLY